MTRLRGKHYSKALALRQWARKVNALGELEGREQVAGDPGDPRPEYVRAYERGLSPDQVQELDFNV